MANGAPGLAALAAAHLHDGRGASLRDAVLAHGGEGPIVRDRFRNLGEPDQDAAYAFLTSL